MTRITTKTLMAVVIIAGALCGCERAVPTSTSPAKIPVRMVGLSSQVGDCAVHGAAKIEDTVPILNGQIYIDPATTNFPNAWTFVAAGCTVTADSPTQAVVYFCPICREAERKWKRQHGK